MKKLLLSMALLAGFTAAAADTTLNVADATDIQGVYHDEEPPSATSQYGQAARYQPLTSLQIGGYTFSFAKGAASTEPALYMPMSTNPDGAKTVRIYGKKDGTTATGNTMTIAAPAGSTFKSIKFTGSNGAVNGVISASVGTVAMPSKTEVNWSNTEAVSTVTFTMGQSYRFTSLVVSTETGGTTPDDPGTTATFTKVTENFTAGQYIFVVDGKIANPIKETYTYGRMYLDTDANIVDGKITCDATLALTVASATEGFTLKDTFGRYYGMDEQHATFQCYTELNEGCYWAEPTFVDGQAKMFSTLRTDYFLGNEIKNVETGEFYTTFAPTNKTEAGTFKLPEIYKLDATGGVESVEVDVDANAPVVYYNLQGQRVENPNQGLYIRVQGKKATKVVL